jgi:hypothetical protein
MNIPHTQSRSRTGLKILLITLLLVGSVMQLQVGLADSGDYTRMMLWLSSGPSGFEENWPAEGTIEHEWRFFNYVLPFWELDVPLQSRWVHSILLVWLPGVLLNIWLYSADTLYLPFLSFAPRLFMVLFLWMLLRWIDRESGRHAPLLYLLMGLPVVFIGFNTGYVAYYVSFFQEPASMIGLLLIVLTAAYYAGRADGAWRPWLSAAAVMFVTTAKLSNIHWALLGGLLLIPWELLVGRARRRAVYILLVIVMPIGFSFLQASLYHSRLVNAYQSIFSGALMFSDRPQEHLDRLGMTDGARYIGEHAFCEAGEEAMKKYAPLLHHRTTIGIILREPSIAWDMLVFAADSMQRVELTHLSRQILHNEPHTTPPWPSYQSAFTAQDTPLNTWSRLKRSVFPAGYPLLLLLFLFAVLPALAWNHPHRMTRVCARVTVMSALAVLVEMWMQVFGDGQRDMIKHLYLANLCFDMMLIAALGMLAGLRNTRDTGRTT